VALNLPTYDYKIVTPRTGTGTISAGSDVCVVAAAGVAADSMIKVVLTSNPSEEAGGAEVERVIKDVGVGFTLGMTGAVQNATTFDYLIV
jgi:hypothetical protein